MTKFSFVVCLLKGYSIIFELGLQDMVCLSRREKVLHFVDSVCLNQHWFRLFFLKYSKFHGAMSSMFNPSSVHILWDVFLKDLNNFFPG